MPPTSTEIADSPEHARGPDLLDWAVLGETLAHEVNNLLNNIVLHLAVLEQGGIPAEQRAQTAAIRQKGRQAAALIKSLERHCRSWHPPLASLNLNVVLRDVVAALTGRSDGESRVPIDLQLSDDLPEMLGEALTLQRLLELLLSHFLSRPSCVSGMVLRTGCVEGRPRVCVECTASLETPTLLGQFLGLPVPDDSERLDYARCKTLARRLQASFSGELRADNTA